MFGLIMPPLLAVFFSLIGLPLPFAIPTLGSLALAALFWFMPNYNAADDAKKARIEFSRALGAYIDMVATGVRDGSSRSEEHTSELQSLMRISYAVFCLKKKTYKDK